MAVLKYLGSDNLYHALPIGDSISVLQPDEYSEEEIVIGKWIDGRPIYRKVYKVNELTITTSIQSYTLENPCIINELISSNVKYVYNNSAADYEYMNSSIDRSIVFAANLSMNNTIFRLQYYGNSSNNNSKVKKVTVIAEYTKTTDAENSFTPDMLTTTSLGTTATDAEVNFCLS